MAARRRLLSTGVLVALILSGCTYSTTEPGFFATRGPSPSARPTRRPPPPPTRLDLPVAGQAVWTTGDGLDVTVRFAVHAVRRIPGATVLDWSVTPLTAPGRRAGDDLPPQLDLGLSTVFGGDVNIALLDDTGAYYPPLRHRSRRLFNHCLCTPLWAVQQQLRLGETRLLQVSFPQLPVGAEFVDVALPNVAPFSHVPVSPVGTAPATSHDTDLTRPPEGQPPAARPVRIRYADLRQAQTIQVERVVAGPTWTTMEWTIHSVTDQSRLSSYGLPVSSETRPAAFVLNDSPVDGPRLRAGSTVLAAGWIRSRRYGGAAYTCRCSELGLWARALTRAGGSLTVTTTYPRLPARTMHLDVVLPGFGRVTDVPVTRAADSAAGLGRATPRPTGTWRYLIETPPTGSPAQDWPTDVPDSEQLTSYLADVYQLVDRPAA